MQRSAIVVPAHTLSADERAAMYALYARHYDATEPELFARDLEDKDNVLLLRDGLGAIVGFTTMAVRVTTHQGVRLRTIFSGDTLIDPHHWGRQDLAFNWIEFAGHIKSRAPDLPLYWFLIVKGYRTYRYLSAFSIDFQPHWQRQASSWQASLMHHLGRERFGTAYDEATGLIRFERSRGQLKPALASVDPADAARPDVQYFLARNPGYAEGHELLCVTELGEENLRPVARRQFVRGLRS